MPDTQVEPGVSADCEAGVQLCTSEVVLLRELNIASIICDKALVDLDSEALGDQLLASGAVTLEELPWAALSDQLPLGEARAVPEDE